MQFKVDNPYLELWEAERQNLPARQAELIATLMSRDNARVLAAKKSRERFIHKYACAVPTDEALEIIVRFSPLIEIGAGTGYWAWLLKQLGADIICYDTDPPGSRKDDAESPERSQCWTEVLRGDESAVDDHPDRTLFLCWPPAGDPMAYRALRRYRGDFFIYVGEEPLPNGDSAANGDDAFFQLLEREWSLVQLQSLPNWELCWDRLYVFQRNALPSPP